MILGPIVLNQKYFELKEILDQKFCAKEKFSKKFLGQTDFESKNLSPKNVLCQAQAQLSSSIRLL